TQTSPSSPIDTQRSAPTKPSVLGTQPSASKSNSNLGSSLSQQSNFGDVASNTGNTQTSPSSPIDTQRSAPTKPSVLGTQPSASKSNSNLGSSLSQQSNFGDVASNTGNTQTSPSSPIDTQRSAPTKPSVVGTQPSANNQSNSGIGDTLNNLGNFEDGGVNPGNPGSGELAALKSPLQGSNGSREKPTKPSPAYDSDAEGVSCINCPKPSYPGEAREKGLEGNPRLRIDIDFDGNVTNVRLEKSSGHPILDEAAINAVKGWKLDSKDGGRIGVLVTLKFRLR
ncbi:MAG: energy transducer TonB, partial [Trichodesmium sp. MAG_R04]|nr:energy transducer TonB [Trichodesmium sp. MAG_R04]